MSTPETRSESASSASSKAPCLEALPGLALHNILRRACAYSDHGDLVNLLLSSKKLRSEVLACCKGLIKLEYTTAKTASETEAFAQWLFKHGQLASSLTFCSAVKWPPDEEDDGNAVNQDLLAQLDAKAEHDRSLIEGAVAAGLQQAANNSNSESAGAGLYLQACCLYDAGPNVAAVLQQLPASCLTSLRLQMTQPNTSEDYPPTYLRPLLSSFERLTNLKSLELGFDAKEPKRFMPYHVDVDPMIKQMSSLTNLTSLRISRLRDGDVLKHLPASLQRLESRWAEDHLEEYPLLSLGHLTALTNLEVGDHITIRHDDDLPPNLPTLEVADIQDVTPLLLLTKLEALTLNDGYYAAAADLQKLSVLAALSYVKVCGDNDPEWGNPEKLKAIKQALEGLPNLKSIICEW